MSSTFKAKQLILLLATFILAIKACKNAYASFATENSFLLALHILLLNGTPWIHHISPFKKNQTKI